MAVKWNWDEFDAERSIILTPTTHAARYSNYNLVQFFAKYGKFTSFVRLNAGKCIAIAKYVSKSDAESALHDDSLAFYGLKTNRCNECMQYTQFDMSMYSYMSEDEIVNILQGFCADPDLLPPYLEMNKEEETLTIRPLHCLNCNGNFCLPNECLTAAWIDAQSKSDEPIVVDDTLIAGEPIEDLIAGPIEGPNDEQIKEWAENPIQRESIQQNDDLDADFPDAEFIESDGHSVDERMSEFSIPTQSKVYLTHVASGNTVYIRPASKQNHHAYIKLLTNIAEYCENAPAFTEKPKIDDIIAALFDNIFFRCRVVYVSAHCNELLVDFIDFGNVEKIKLSSARVLAEEFQVIKPSVKVITLKDMPNECPTSKKFLKSLVNSMKRLVLVYENGPHESKLIDDKTGKSIDAYFRDKMGISPAVPVAAKANRVSKRLTPQLKEIEYRLTDGQNVPVVTISNSLIQLGYIHVIHQCDLVQFKTNDDLVNKVGRTTEMLSPHAATVPGELCLVKLYDVYYRAIFMESKYKGVERYEFIDFGYILPIKKQDVRRLPSSLLFPCITIKCFLDVLPPVNTKLSRITEEEAKQLQSRFTPFEKLTIKRMKAKPKHNYCICHIRVSA